MLKETNVVMLPTNEKALNLTPIVMFRDKIFGCFSGDYLYDNAVFQHLYITSDEKPVNDDWCIQNGNYLCKITCNQDRTQQGLKKIIATTDKSLGLPTVSDGFIRKFIERYNAGNPITKVMVEYEEYVKQELISGTIASFRAVSKSKLKVDKNNCITIRPVKESWTREELPIEVMKDMLRYCEVNQIYDKLSNFGDFYYKGKKWIEQNL